MNQLLDGLVIVEASRDVAVRFCGRLFAQLGATVVRAEGGDDTGIGYGGEAGEAYGRWLDVGKISERAQDHIDLVIAGLDGASVMAGDDIAYEHPSKPSLVVINWFHPDGAYAAWRGTDEIIQALTGLTYGLGPIAGPPVIAQGHGPQLTAGVVAFNAAMGALFANPRPRRIETNVMEAYLCLYETAAVSALVEGGVQVRLGVNRMAPVYPGASYRSADGWVGVTAVTPSQWRAFTGLIGRSDMAEDVRYTTTLERLLLADEVDAVVAPILKTRTTDEWVQLGIAGRVPITDMPDLASLPDVPHWKARGAFAPVGEGGPVGPTIPWRAEFTGQAQPAFVGGETMTPLKGLKVVDFTMGWAGPLTTRDLADLGADVIKIESAQHQDWWRGWETDQSGDPPPQETKFSFISVNRNKRGIVLELDTAEGLAHARALVAQADILVENFGDSVLDKLGLGAAARRTINPNLLALTMPAFGAGGPLSGVRAYGSTVEQASGLPHANGEAHWPPSLQHVAFGDPLCGHFGAASLLAALWGRKTHGGGEIDMAQVACLFQYSADALIAQQFADGPLPRTGSRRSRGAPVCVVPTKGEDAWLTVAAVVEDSWFGLTMLLEREDWRDDPGLKTIEGRNARAEEIEAAVAAWAKDQDAGEAAWAMQGHGVPAAPVLRVDQLSYEPQLADTGFWPEIERRYVGRHIIPATPFLFDWNRLEIRNPAPTLGEHTAEVLAELGR